MLSVTKIVFHKLVEFGTVEFDATCRDCLKLDLLLLGSDNGGDEGDGGGDGGDDS